MNYFAPMDLPPISHSVVLADGSVRLTASKSRLVPMLPMFLVVPAVMLDFRGWGYAGVFGAFIFAVATLLFVASLIIWPHKNVFLFDVTRQELHVSYGQWKQSAWSVPFSDITRVWLAHDGPSVFERFTVMLTANNKTYSLFKAQGFWLTSTALNDIRRTLPDCDIEFFKIINK